MHDWSSCSDEALLEATARHPEAFGEFYRRHVRGLAAYFMRRTGDAEVTADLTAETIAAALEGSRRFRASKGSALAWLYGIAGHELSQGRRRGRVEDRARRRVGMPTIALDDEALERIEAVAAAEGTAVLELVEQLPADQRTALRARVIHERDYEDIARSHRASESTIRKRVSRALSGLRASLEDRT
jgi:RNA polymerase sigma factor (sigma-70 family)